MILVHANTDDRILQTTLRIYVYYQHFDESEVYSQGSAFSDYPFDQHNTVF